MLLAVSTVGVVWTAILCKPGLKEGGEREGEIKRCERKEEGSKTTFTLNLKIQIVLKRLNNRKNS